MTFKNLVREFNAAVSSTQSDSEDYSLRVALDAPPFVVRRERERDPGVSRRV
jgi:hypothetical protein